MSVERYFLLICVVLVGINLLYGRRRAAALVQSGRVTLHELNTFSWSTFILVGGAFFAFWIVAELDQSDIHCLLEFPPRRVAQLAVWTIQAILSGSIVFWLWARNGADILARLAPAFGRGSILGREFSPARVRWVVSVFVIAGPLLAIVAQLAQPGIAACEKL